MGDREVTKFYIQWHITDKCNLSCMHCYVNNKKKELSLVKMKKGVDSVLRPVSSWVDEIEICFSGGEPFLSPFLEELVLHIKKWKKVKRVMFTSNGTIVNKKVLSRIRKHVDNIQISLEGGKKINDQIRGEEVYEKVKNNIPQYKSLGWEVSVNMTIHKLNYMDVPLVIDFCLQNQVDVFAVARFVPSISDKNSKKMMLSATEVEKLYKEMYQLSLKNEKLKFSFKRPLWCLVDERIGAKCSVGISSISILPDGTLLPCRRLEIPLGNFLTDNFVEIWTQSKILNEIRRKSDLEKCSSCEYFDKCAGCRAIAYAGSDGSLLATDPQCFR